MQDLKSTFDEIVDYIRGMWIKKRFIIISSWFIIPLGLGYVYFLPDKYQSESKIYVDTRSMLQPLLRGLAVESNPQQELAMIVQTLLSRENIEKIARGADLDITAKNNVEYAELIEDLTSDIRLRRLDRRDNLFTITYSHASARTAQVVVQETLDLFVEGALGEAREDSNTANRFLNEQISDYELRLSQSEQQLADFQRRYAYLLPVAGSFYQKLQELETELDNVQLTRREAIRQKDSLLQQLKLRQNASLSNSGITTGDEPRITTVYDQRISALESRLDELKLRFTDRHPDVIETTKSLNNLLETREKSIAEFAQSQSSESDALANVNEMTLDIHSELSKVESLIASIQVRELDYQEKIRDLKAQIDLVPQVEAEQIALNRDYEILKQKYTELLSRKESADISQKADASSDDLKFRIIEPPQLPLQPSSPNRLILYTLVVIIGFGAGLGIAFVVSQFSPILLRANQITQISDFPILGTVSHLEIDSMKRAAKFRVLVFALSSSVLIIAYLILVAAEILQIDLIGVLS